ncbi:hypothetical protein [Nitrospirillum bahiense]|uniref:hypothetical protein n=1 Tax=Nitrospirillum amazonense TaxID=28077 RepID=UPI0011A00071|nr:hypothetical protein [Nitrospirillum amazonense]
MTQSIFAELCFCYEGGTVFFNSMISHRTPRIITESDRTIPIRLGSNGEITTIGKLASRGPDSISIENLTDDDIESTEIVVKYDNVTVYFPDAVYSDAEIWISVSLHLFDLGVSNLADAAVISSMINKIAEEFGENYQIDMDYLSNSQNPKPRIR